MRNFPMIALSSCAPFERIVINTLNNVYELIVLSGDAGDVLVRGGRFPEFCRARVAGSTAGGTALTLKTIVLGLRLELRVAGIAIVTSTIQAATRVRDGELSWQ